MVCPVACDCGITWPNTTEAAACTRACVMGDEQAQAERFAARANT